MAIVFRLDGILLPFQTVRMNTDEEQGVIGLPSAAWYGEPSHGSLRIEDPSGVLTLDDQLIHTFTVEETACTGNERIFTGWLWSLSVSRGNYRTAAGRVWECEIVDQNWALNLVTFRSSADSLRPAETDVERTQAALDSSANVDTPVHDNGRFETAGPLSLSESNFVGQFMVDMIGSSASQSGKNFYTYWDDTANQISLHYDVVGVGPAASISFSNVLSDVNLTTVFAPSIDATLRTDSSALYTSVLLGYAGANWVYARNQDLIDALSPTEFSPSEFVRDLVEQSARISRLATANAYVQKVLAIHSEAEVKLTFMVQLPASKVNLARAGDIVNVRFSHLRGYTSSTPVAIIRRNVIPTNGTDDLYDVYFECANKGEPHTAGGGDPGDTPVVSSCDGDAVAVVQSAHASMASAAGDPGVDMEGPSWASPPTPGNLLLYGLTAHGQQGFDPGHIPGWTAVVEDVDFVGTGGAGGSVSLYYKIAGTTEDTQPTFTGGAWSNTNLSKSQAYLVEVAGVDSLDTFVSGILESSDTTPGLPITPTTGRTEFIITFQEHSQGPPTSNPDPLAGVTELYSEGNISDASNPGRWVGYMAVETDGSAYDVNPIQLAASPKWATITAAFYCSGGGGDTPPQAATQVKGDQVGTGDGTTVTFTTRFPYANGSLRVFVDGVPIVNGITESDPVTGEFTLDFAPLGASGDTRAEIVTADYQTRPG